MTPKNEPRKWYAKFPGEPEPEPVGEGRTMCGAIKPGESPYTCTLLVGHSGSHMAEGCNQQWAEPESEPVAPREFAEAFPVGVFLQEEMDARRWTTEHVAALMGGDPQVNQLTLELILAVPNHEMSLAQETAEGLSRAFGVSAEMFINLDKAYREWMKQPESTPRPEPSALAPTQPRCLITGNPCGTDTRPVGQPCPCANCKAEVIQPQPSAAGMCGAAFADQHNKAAICIRKAGHDGAHVGIEPIPSPPSEELARRIAEYTQDDILTPHGMYGELRCFFCGADEEAEHKDDCIWKLAQKVSRD